MVYVLLRIFNLLHYRVLESLMSYVDQCEKLYVDHEELKEELERLKSILLDAGAKTHQCYSLHKWYCENGERDESNL